VRAATLAAPHPGTTGLSFSFSLSQEATVRYAILRRVRSPVWSFCPPAGGTAPITFAGVWRDSLQATAGQHHTTLAATASRLARGGSPTRKGRRRVSLAHLAAGRKLAPGTYLLRITATNANGHTAVPAAVKFWVLGPRR
jgi:hypothetical protein